MAGEHAVVEVSGRVPVRGTELFLRQWGRDRGWPLLFVHQLGVAGSSLHLAEVGSALAATYDARVLAPDLPGFGGSPAESTPEAYRPDALARLLLGLLDTLAIERAAYAGLSWGATIGCHVAALAPERIRALVLLDAGHIDATDQDGFDAAATLDQRIRAAARQFDGFRFRTVDAALNAVSDDYPAWTPALETSWRAGLMLAGGRVRPRLRPHVYAAAVHGLAQAPPSSTWAAIAAAGVPVLLLTADEPEGIRALQQRARERFGAALPHADVRIAHGQRHDLVAGLGTTLATVVGEWLASVGVR